MSAHRLPSSMGEFLFILFAMVGMLVVVGVIISTVASALVWAGAQVAGVSPEVAAGYMAVATLGASAGWIARLVYDLPPEGETNAE